MHPTLLKAYEKECEPFFYSHMLTSADAGGFGILDTEDGQRKLLDMLGDEQVKEHFLDLWAKRQESGKERWDRLAEYAKKKSVKLNSVLVEIIFTYTYPRLDVNVSKGMNHLLKSPWCAHPKTGRVCVPLDPEMAAEFQPSDVPTLRMVGEELDAAKKAGTVLGQGKDISATRLQKYEAAFDGFLKRSENAIRAERVREKGEKASLDF